MSIGVGISAEVAHHTADYSLSDRNSVASRLQYELIHGDTLDRSILPPDSMDLIVTSPPYNVGKAYGEADDTIAYDKYLEFSRRWLENAYYWTQHSGRLCLNVSLDKNKQGKAPLTADLTTIAMAVGLEISCHDPVAGRQYLERHCMGQLDVGSRAACHSPGRDNYCAL